MYFRPLEVTRLCGDATKAREKLGWTPRTSFAELVREMVQADLEAARSTSNQVTVEQRISQGSEADS